MVKDQPNRLLELYLPPASNFRLQSFVATTYELEFAFLEEDLLPVALGVRSPLSRIRAFRLELERELQNTEISVLYDVRARKVTGRLSPRIDPILLRGRKQHSKITLLLWMRPPFESSPAESIVRLILGSANLTRTGYRENYECVTQLDFSADHDTPRFLLEDALSLIRRIAADRISPQLERQLKVFSSFATRLPRKNDAEMAPRALVTADTAVPTIANLWKKEAASPPDKLIVVSPFWPQGQGAAESLADLIRQVHSPAETELVTCGALAPTGNRWLPEFQASLATELKTLYPGELYLRPAMPNLDAAGVVSAEAEEEEAGELLEDDVLGRQRLETTAMNLDVHRLLHAKMLILQNRKHIVLYAGSSNCTRRGLALGGQFNWEAGFVYSLPGKYRKHVEALYEFAGPRVEVLPDKQPKTIEPAEVEEPQLFPYFIREITARGTEVTIEFERDAELPTDLVILMEVSGTGLGSDYRQMYPLLRPTKSEQAVSEPGITDEATLPCSLAGEIHIEIVRETLTAQPETIPELQNSDALAALQPETHDLPESNCPDLQSPPAAGESEHSPLTEFNPPDSHGTAGVAIAVKLEECPRWLPQQNHESSLLNDQGSTTSVTPNVHAEIRWAGTVYEYPVRFDDKADLPVILHGRKPTEGELIEYFLSGREPDVLSEEVHPAHPMDQSGSHRESPIDTRGILSYFIRRFVQAIPGIESQVKRAAYSRPSLESALRGPTSPLELARRAFDSLDKPPPLGEPRKTATAVGFQLVELQAALLRCRNEITQPELKELVNPVLGEIRGFLANVAVNSAEVQSPAFERYCEEFLEAKQ
jgi:hypothetical protein